MELTEIWAKTTPYQSVITHGVVSGNVCKILINEYLSPGTRELVANQLGLSVSGLSDFMAYIASVHDIGKIEYTFQSKDPGMRMRLKEIGVEKRTVGKENIRHEMTGAISISRIWKQQKQDIDSTDIFSSLIGAHHQKNHGKESDSRDPFFADLRQQMEKTMRERFLSDQDFRMPEIPDEEGVFEAVLLGVLILSDWIASSSVFEDAEKWIEQNDSPEIIAEKTADFLENSGLKKASLEWKRDFTEIWPQIPRTGVRLLQKRAEELMGTEKRYRMVLIEAPMGEGKTEAGMYCAVQMLQKWQKDGFYVALPTAATSNQMVSRMNNWFRALGISKKVHLLHGMAWMIDKFTQGETGNSDDGDEVSRWLAPLRRGLLGQFSVGTIDQAMLSVTKAKYGVLRLLGLSNKVLVIDEIHSYDVYMGEFIQQLLRWCRAMEIPVVMLSATLPPKLKARLLAPYTKQALSDGYPLITAVNEDGTVEELSVEKTVKQMSVTVKTIPILNDYEQIAINASRLVEHGGCICVLMNTVKQAQKVYSSLESCFDGERILFHAQFPAYRRQELEAECIRKFGKDKTCRPKKAILVATQVVEQSLDVDFDAMITAVAPIDLVLQRVGRVFRHDDTLRPEHFQSPSLYMLTPEGEDYGVDGYVYPDVLLRQTVHILNGREKVRIPEDLAPLVAEGYDESKVSPNDLEKWLEHLIDEQVEAGQSRKYLIGEPDKQYFALSYSHQFFDDEGSNRYLTVKTRLGEPSVRIALLEDDLYQKVSDCVDSSGLAKVKNRDLATLVQLHTVSVSEKRLKFSLSDLLDIQCDNLLAGVRVYPAINGVCELSGGRICTDRELGLIIEEDKT